MTFIIQAPYPTIQTTSFLPNPEFSDGEGLADEIEVKRAMDGTIRTYVKTKNNRRRLLWDFNISGPKKFEMMAFFRAYYASKVLITDHNNRRWYGNFINNPFEATGTNRGGPNVGDVRGETYQTRLEFEGVAL